MNLLVLSTSLNPESNSRLLARAAHAELTSGGHAVTLLDLRDLPLPLCDGAGAYRHENTAKARALIAAADGILVATPIYNYDANAVVKNLVELTGKAWENKIVGFACCAGGHASYMSIMALANSLMLDFRCTIVPRFVYATEGDFSGETIANAEVARRTQELATTLARYAAALK
ncbi:MAG: NAD(P)H-dependent oxidoreductase [Opitutae bacterium]|nr:NAD(P)H-dependent oxidoreductase [Opitutae bacterium]